MFFASLVAIGPVVLGDKTQMWNIYDDDNENNDERQRPIFVQKRSIESLVYLSSNLIKYLEVCHDIFLEKV